MAKNGENQDGDGQDPEDGTESQERSLDDITDPAILRELVKKNREEAKTTRLEKNRIKKDLDKRVKDEEEAKRKQDEEQGNYKKLYEDTNVELEKLKARVAELEPVATSLETSLKDRIKALPKAIQELAPPEGSSLAAMNEWVTKAEKASKTDSGNQERTDRRLAPEGNRSGPPPATGKDAKKTQVEEDAITLRRGGGYTM